MFGDQRFHNFLAQFGQTAKRTSFVNRHGRFRESDILRTVFEEVVCSCMASGLVGGEGFPNMLWNAHHNDRQFAPVLYRREAIRGWDRPLLFGEWTDP